MESVWKDLLNVILPNIGPFLWMNVAMHLEIPNKVIEI